MSNGPRTAPVRPGRHRGARSVRRESDANRIMFIYTISLGAARFTFLRENERVNSNYNLVINVKLYLMLWMGWSTLKIKMRPSSAWNWASEDGGVKQDDCSGALSGPEFTICVMRARFSFLFYYVYF